MLLLRPRPQLRRLPRQERSTFTFDAILQAAQQVIETRGVDALKMADLASVAGVSPGTLYQYFPDRRTLLTALLDRLCSALRDRFAEVTRDSAPRPEQALLRELAHEAAAATTRLRPLKNALRQHFHVLAAENCVVDISDEYAELLANALARSRGVPQAELLQVSRAIVWATDGILDGVSRGDGPSTEVLAELLLRCWSGLLEAR